MQAVAAEIAKVYHTVKHHLSYNASDCGAKLDSTLFPDSAIVKKMACGRTKAEAIVTNVIAPKSLELIASDLTSSDPLKPTYFAVSTDASNLKNRKMFPICVQYFTIESGVNKKLLDFIEQNDEHSVVLAEMIVSSLSAHRLDIKNVSAYSADNASVNFGCKQSVFTKLKTLNSKIVKANCNAHVLHNTLKKLLDVIHCDVETTVTCVYSHFSISANRRVQLQEFFDFVDLEYHDLLRHVTTRWLSLGPAIDRLLKSWPAIISYFQSLGEDCPQRIKTHLGIQTDTDDGGVQTKVKEAYLCFIQNVCCVFEKGVLALERDDFSFCELFSVMQDVRAKLKDRLKDNYFGFGAQSILKLDCISQSLKQSIEGDFCIGLQKAVTYLEKSFNFSSDTIACTLQPFALKVAPTFKEFSDACSILGLNDETNQDLLYDEFSSSKDGMQHVVLRNELSAGEKWKEFFKSCEEHAPPTLFKLVSFVMSLPSSNAFPERVFSLMGSKWRSERNRASVELIKSELQVFVNFDYKCGEFYHFVLQQQKLLDAAASNKKYVVSQTKATSSGK